MTPCTRGDARIHRRISRARARQLERETEGRVSPGFRFRHLLHMERANCKYARTTITRLPDSSSWCPSVPLPRVPVSSSSSSSGKKALARQPSRLHPRRRQPARGNLARPFAPWKLDTLLMESISFPGEGGGGWRLRCGSYKQYGNKDGVAYGIIMVIR